MNAPSLTATALEDSQALPLDQLYRVSPDVYRGLIEHGLIARDRVRLVDGLLVNVVDNEPVEGSESDLLDRLYRIPLDVYDRIANIGLLGPSDKVELLDGLLVKMMTKGDPHTGVAMQIQDTLRGLVPPGWIVKKEDPITLPTGPKGRASQPEPDVTVARGTIREYMTRKPGPDDVALVVEVAESSVREDRSKLGRYAWSKIPVAWIVNLIDETVEVYTRPTGPAELAKYEDVQIYQKDDRLPVVVDGREVGTVAVRDLLP